MSKPKFQPSNVLLVEVPHQFIALCEASGASPQAALRGMAAMVSTTAGTGWCRWRAKPRDGRPGAGRSRARTNAFACLVVLADEMYDHKSRKASRPRVT